MHSKKKNQIDAQGSVISHKRVNGSNQEIKYKEPIKKDASTSIPQKTQDKELPKKDSSTKQDNKPIIEVRHTIIPPQNLDFVAIIDQPSAPPPFIYPVSQWTAQINQTCAVYQLVTIIE